MKNHFKSTILFFIFTLLVQNFVFIVKAADSAVDKELLENPKVKKAIEQCQKSNSSSNLGDCIYNVMKTDHPDELDKINKEKKEAEDKKLAQSSNDKKKMVPLALKMRPLWRENR